MMSFIVSCAFLLVIFFAVTNEDKPQGAAIPVLVLTALAVGSCFIAWRWEKVGGVIVILSALCLNVAAYSASLSFGLGRLSLGLSLIYGVPFLIVGVLFWLSGRRNEHPDKTS